MNLLLNMYEPWGPKYKSLIYPALFGCLCNKLHLQPSYCLLQQWNTVLKGYKVYLISEMTSDFVTSLSVCTYYPDGITLLAYVYEEGFSRKLESVCIYA